MEALAREELEVRRARLALEREELQQRRRKLEAEAAAEKRRTSAGGIVRLNVGGVAFDTTRETLLLCRNADPANKTMFELMLAYDAADGDPARSLDDDNAPRPLASARRDETGRWFVDRDPEVFRVILQMLRDGGRTPVDRSRRKNADAILAELEYLNLERLAYAVRGAYNPYAMPEADRKLRDAAMAWKRQRREYSTGMAGTADVAPQPPDDDILVKMLDGSTPPWFSCCAPPGDDEPDVLFARTAERARRLAGYTRDDDDDDGTSDAAGGTRPPGFPKTDTEALRRLRLFAGPLFERAIEPEIAAGRVVVAGGAVLAALLTTSENDAKRRSERSDVDLFLVGGATAPDLVPSLFRRCRDAVFSDVFDAENAEREAYWNARPFMRAAEPETIPTEELLVARSPHAVTFVVGHPQRHMQLVLPHFGTVAEVLTRFDIAACQVALTATGFVGTPQARRALETGRCVAEPSLASPTFEQRHRKYARRGFDVRVPGLDRARLDPTLATADFWTYARNGALRAVRFAPDKSPLLAETAKVVGPPATGLAKLVVYARADDAFSLAVPGRRRDEKDPKTRFTRLRTQIRERLKIAPNKKTRREGFVVAGADRMVDDNQDDNNEANDDAPHVVRDETTGRIQRRATMLLRLERSRPFFRGHAATLDAHAPGVEDVAFAGEPLVHSLAILPCFLSTVEPPPETGGSGAVVQIDDVSAQEPLELNDYAQDKATLPFSSLISASDISFNLDRSYRQFAQQVAEETTPRAALPPMVWDFVDTPDAELKYVSDANCASHNYFTHFLEPKGLTCNVVAVPFHQSAAFKMRADVPTQDVFRFPDPAFAAWFRDVYSDDDNNNQPTPAEERVASDRPAASPAQMTD